MENLCPTSTVPENEGDVDSLTFDLTWTPKSQPPCGYYINVGSNDPPSNVLSRQDTGLAYKSTVTVSGRGTYYWQLIPYSGSTEVACDSLTFEVSSGEKLYFGLILLFVVIFI